MTLNLGLIVVIASWDAEEVSVLIFAYHRLIHLPFLAVWSCGEH